MANKVKLEIKETVDELKELIRDSDNIQVKERLQVLYLLKSGQVTTLKEASKILLKDISTVSRWVKWDREGGLTKLVNIYQPQGKPCSIPALIVEKLKERLADPKGFQS